MWRANRCHVLLPMGRLRRPEGQDGGSPGEWHVEGKPVSCPSSNGATSETRRTGWRITRRVACGGQTGVMSFFQWGDFGDQKDRMADHPESGMWRANRCHVLLPMGRLRRPEGQDGGSPGEWHVEGKPVSCPSSNGATSETR